VNIDKFKHEHVVLLTLVTELRGLVQSGVQEHAAAILHQLIEMSSVIKLHLAAEDRVLYPAVIKATDPVIAQMGRRYQTEMGGIAAAYTAFVARWNLAANIAENPQTFRDDANTVFKSLHERVQHENREFYPMVERI
jgi:hemerythrin-like domain-containing protein